MKPPFAICVLFLLLSGSHGVCAQDAAQSLLSAVQIDHVEKLIRDAMSTRGIPGMSVAISVGGSIVFDRGFGRSDVENAVPATAETLYRTASIAKPMTAVAVLSLMEDSQLELDDSVQQYVSEFPKKRWPVTLRQLLGHLSGVRHYARSGESTGTTHFKSVRQSLSIFQDDRLLHEPGTKFHYTTYGYNLLGAIAEEAAGHDFSHLLNERVFKPAGMTDTQTDNHFLIIANRTRGYIRRRTATAKQTDDGEQEIGQLFNAPMHDTSMKVPGGGLLSTSADLVRFASSVNSGKLLNDESVKQMWTRQRTKDGEETNYGLGWRIGGINEQRLISHSGGQAGTSTYLMLLPDSNVSVAVMCNLQSAGLKTLTRSLLELSSTIQPKSTSGVADNAKPNVSTHPNERPKTVRITLAQIPVTTDITANMKQIRKSFEVAQQDNADWILFPEGALSGYTPEINQDEVATAYAQVQQLCRDHSVAAIVGTSWTESNMTYNQIRVVDRDGEHVSSYSKMCLCYNENYEPGRSPGIVALDGVRFGVLICNDMWVTPGYTDGPNPHLSKKLAKSGVDLILQSVNSGANQNFRGYHEENLKIRAAEAKCPIVTVNAAREKPNNCTSGVVVPFRYEQTLSRNGTQIETVTVMLPVRKS